MLKNNIHIDVYFPKYIVWVIT